MSGDQHISFTTTKIGSLIDIKSSRCGHLGSVRACVCVCVRACGWCVWVGGVKMIQCPECLAVVVNLIFSEIH